MSMTLTEAPSRAVRFHLSLNVADLGRSVAFYRALFGYTQQQVGDGEQFDYTAWSLGSQPVCGRLRMTAPKFCGSITPSSATRSVSGSTAIAPGSRILSSGASATTP